MWSNYLIVESFSSNFAVKLFRVTVIRLLMLTLEVSLHAFFGKHLDHMLVKFEQNGLYRNIQNFEHFSISTIAAICWHLRWKVSPYISWKCFYHMLVTFQNRIVHATQTIELFWKKEKKKVLFKPYLTILDAISGDISDAETIV